MGNCASLDASGDGSEQWSLEGLRSSCGSLGDLDLQLEQLRVCESAKTRTTHPVTTAKCDKDQFAAYHPFSLSLTDDDILRHISPKSCTYGTYGHTASRRSQEHDGWINFQQRREQVEEIRRELRDEDHAAEVVAVAFANPLVGRTRRGAPPPVYHVSQPVVSARIRQAPTEASAVEIVFPPAPHAEYSLRDAPPALRRQRN